MHPLARTAMTVCVVLAASVVAVPLAGSGQTVAPGTRPKDGQMTSIRKQVSDLTPADLKECPVWEFALDEEGVEGQDEATVRPMPAAYALDPGAGTLVVRATFRLADGTKMEGYLTPPPDAEPGLGSIQPVIVSGLGQVGFWMGVIRPQPSDLAKLYLRLGKSASQVFPLQFESNVELKSGRVSGTIPGFLVIKSFQDRLKPEVLK